MTHNIGNILFLDSYESSKQKEMKFNSKRNEEMMKAEALKDAVRLYKTTKAAPAKTGRISKTGRKNEIAAGKI